MNAYRQGDAQSLVAAFADGTAVAASESRVTAQRLREIPLEWRALTGPVREGSAMAALLELLPVRPIVSSDDVCTVLDVSRSSAFAALDRLRDAGVLRPLTDRKRNQVCRAGAILDELDDLGIRIAVKSR